MDKKEFHRLVKEEKIKPKRLKNTGLAFLMGGFLGLLGQGMYQFFDEVLKFSTADANTMTYLIFIFVAALLTGIGIYDNLAQTFGAGVFIPITGFANSLASEALETKSEGMIYGIGSNIFKLAGSVLAYGTIASFILASLYHLVEILL